MKLLEHESKSLLAECDIPVPRSSLITDKVAPFFPVVLKSQVPTGGRGKAGGIIVAKNQAEFETAIAKLHQLKIKNFLPKNILAEKKLDIKKELYLSLSINRDHQQVILMAHTQGGIEVEDNKDFKLWNLDYDSFNVDVIGQELADYYGLPEQTFVLQDLFENLYTCFVRNDATLIEINPLILTAKNELVAGDCKMTLDDAAAFRHDWDFEEKPSETNFVTIDPNGTIATVANGAGLAMATIDAVYDAGFIPANFLDIGGGASAETLEKVFARLAEYPNIQAIVINVFAGITRADEVARAIITAQKNSTHLPTLFIRLAGTNENKAQALLKKGNITTFPDLSSCLAAAKEIING